MSPESAAAWVLIWSTAERAIRRDQVRECFTRKKGEAGRRLARARTARSRAHWQEEIAASDLVLAGLAEPLNLRS